MAQKMRKKTGKPKKSILFRLCILAFVTYAAVSLVDMQVTLASRKLEVEALEMRLERQRLENKDLERQLQAGVDKEYIERMARDQLDYVYPEERVYIDISGS